MHVLIKNRISVLLRKRLNLVAQYDYFGFVFFVTRCGVRRFLAGPGAWQQAQIAVSVG
jgi:hypothetical protein